jgi:dihydrofolate reductase
MRKLIVLSFITLDGVMQAPGGPDEDPTGGFEYGGWTVGYWDEFLGSIMDEQMANTFDLLLGRKTYEIFAAYWPYVKRDDPIAGKLNSAKKYVATKTLGKLDWSNSTIIKGDTVQEITMLKQQNGPELQVHGSGNLIQTLLKHDLIDEFRLKIFPITLGIGKRLFGDGTIPAGFRLVDNKTSTTGVIVATYERAGKVKTGSFALETPAKAELARRKRLKEGK